MILLLATALATATPASAADLPPKADRDAAAALVRALKSGDKPAVARLVQYPLRRPLPLAPIQKPEELVAHFDEYFDDKNIAAILGSPEPEQVGWRRTMIAGGLLWFSDGKIYAINLWTDRGRADLEEAIKREAPSLHASARGYDSLEFVCAASKHLIRVERFGDDLRYFSWRAGHPLSEPPELALVHGTKRVEGTADLTSYVFTHGEYTYSVGDDGLQVSRRDAPILEEDCH